MKDAGLFYHINELAEEEERLFAKAGDGSGLSQAELERLEEIKVELDQGYDLLHQREARRAAGLDPSDAVVRPPEIVEHYKQ
jgi:IS5 family transposase